MSWDAGLNPAIAAACAAATDASRWETMLEALCERFGATAAAIHTPRGAPAGKPLFVDIGLPQHTVPDYIDYWSQRDPWFAGAATKEICVRTGECGIGRELCEWSELERMDYYHEFAAPTGVHGLLAMIVDDGSRPAQAPLTAIGLYRRPGLEEFSYQDKRAFEAAHKPLQLALHAHWSLVRSTPVEKATADAFDVVPKPLVVLAATGAILHANVAAAALLSRSDWIGIRNGKLARLGQLGPEAVEASLREVARGLIQTHVLWTPETARPSAPAIARLVPLDEGNACRLAWPHAVALLMVEEPPEREASDRRLEALALQYRLTPSELQLVVQLSEGARPAQVAERCGISINTVRTHLRNIFDKTGVRRQSELIRLLGPLALSGR